MTISSASTSSTSWTRRRPSTPRPSISPSRSPSGPAPPRRAAEVRDRRRRYGPGRGNAPGHDARLADRPALGRVLR
ncbi:MAG: hypothetical protein MZV64_52555 [Ignavibacteriales bacterium]|nr:hypothetical protein [Ignavibacteriales bacterium]